MAEETRKILLELSFDTVEAVKRQKELKDLIKATNKELENTDIGTEEYKKLEAIQGQLQSRLKGLKDSTKQSNAELIAQKGSVRDLQAQYSQLTKALREAAPGTEVLGKSFRTAQKEAFELKQQIKEFEAQLGNTAPNVGNYGDKFKEAAGGVQVFGTSMKELFTVLLVNPFVLILAGLTALGKMLMQNDTIATTFKGVMTGLGIVFDKVSAVVSEIVLSIVEFIGKSETATKVLKEGFIRTLNSIIAPFKLIIDLSIAAGKAMNGEYAEAAKLAGKATADFGKSLIGLNNEVPEFIENLGKAVGAGKEYEDALDRIEAAQSRLNVEVGQMENARDLLKIQSGDLKKSAEERERLGERAIAIDKQILSKRLALLDQEIAAQEKYFNALGKDSVKKEEAEFRLNDLQVKRLQFQNESLKFQEKQQNKINALIEKQLAEEAKLTKEQEDARKKREEDERKLAERIIESDNKLTQFKLDNTAKRAKDIDERLAAELKAEDFRVSVLLSKEGLLASEKEFIQADSAARIYEINKSYEEKAREEATKTANHKKEVFKNTESDITGFLTQSNNTANALSDIRANKELAALNKRQAQELKAAGNNKQKQEEINKKYDEKRAAAEKEAAIRAAESSKVQALINGALAFTKSLTAAPFPFNLILAAGTAVATGVQIAKIDSETDKLADGGFIKNFGKAASGTIIGGKPHSQGGTKFYGEDGTRFEAEKGELLAVVNKRDTPLLSMLSNVNSIHGKPFFRDGGIQGHSYLADGGFTARANSQPVENSISQRNQLIELMASQPNPVVFVEDVNTGQGRVAQVKSKANL
jgi:hypothetical protein